MEEPNDDIERLMEEAREEEEEALSAEESLTDEVAAEDKNGRHLLVGRIGFGVTICDSMFPANQEKEFHFF